RGGMSGDKQRLKVVRAARQCWPGISPMSHTPAHPRSPTAGLSQLSIAPAFMVRGRRGMLRGRERSTVHVGCGRGVEQLSPWTAGASGPVLCYVLHAPRAAHGMPGGSSMRSHPRPGLWTLLPLLVIFIRVAPVLAAAPALGACAGPAPGRAIPACTALLQ